MLAHRFSIFSHPRFSIYSHPRQTIVKLVSKRYLSTKWVVLNFMFTHTAVHGSSVARLYLTPDRPTPTAPSINPSQLQICALLPHAWTHDCDDPSKRKAPGIAANEPRRAPPLTYAAERERPSKAKKRAWSKPLAPGVARGVACSRVLLAPARHVRARLSNRRFEWGGAQPATQIGICVKFTLYSPKFSLYGRERGALLFVYVM